MKTRVISLILSTATVLAALTSLAISHGMHHSGSTSAREFEVRGKVLALDLSAQTLRIAHQEIPGYMPAMVMPLRVQNPALLRQVEPGETIQFQLIVTEDDSWISRLRKLSDPSAAESLVTAQEGERLQPGETIPELPLIDQNGQALDLRRFRGQAVILTFIYTRCPLPNFCPLMSRNFASLQERFEKQFAGRFHLISISIDPEFDRPEILKSYSIRWNANEKDWTFATGTREQIDAAATLFGLTHEPENGFIAHDLRTALISPNGKLLHIWKSNAWTPLEVERKVRECLSPPAQAAGRANTTNG